MRGGALVLTTARAVALGSLAWLGLQPGASSAAAPFALARPAAPAQTAITYRHVDTWAGRPWELVAGRYGRAVDISSAPDGTVYVLDARHQAIHVLDRDGTPLRVFALEDTGRLESGFTYMAHHLDVARDGTILVLLSGGDTRITGLARVDLLMPDGTRYATYELEPPGSKYADIAAGVDTSFLLSRTLLGGIFAAPGDVGVDVYGFNGQLLSTIDDEHLTYPAGLDVDADGTVYVINLIPNPGGMPPPGPTPTPEPSGARLQRAVPGQDPVAVEGVVIFDPDHAYVDTVPFSNAEDVAVGPAGVYVARHIEIFRLGEREPLFSGPTGRITAAYFGRTAFHLDVPAGHRLLASINHCFTQGVAVFERPDDRPSEARLTGHLDGPELEGPVYPLRIDADQWVAAMSGRYTVEGTRPDVSYGVSDYNAEGQVVQRWGEDGTLLDQLGLCSGEEAWWVQDVAVSGDTVFSADPSAVRAHPDASFPTWRYWPGQLVIPDGTSRLTRVAADPSSVAALDIGASAVVVTDHEGALTASVPYAGFMSGTPVDLAIRGASVYLADGAGRVVVLGLDGSLIREVTLHDPPRAIDVSAEGDLFVLGRSGWGLRYDPSGALVAKWRLPDERVRPLDIAVDAGGRVYVNYVSLLREELVDYTILDAGLWVFEAVEGEPTVPPPAGSACLAAPDKTAAPAVLPLGDEVDVRLTVSGGCPGLYDPLQVVLLVDNSRSMNFDDAAGRAFLGLMDILESLDPASAEVGLATFDSVAGVVEPLGRDTSRVAQRAAALSPWGGTSLTEGLAVAEGELTGPRGNPQARQAVLLLTDGVFDDDPTAAADELRSAGIDLYIAVYSTREYYLVNRGMLETMTGDAGRVEIDPRADHLGSMARSLTGFTPTDGLFRTITISDVVPSNMRYVTGSAVPPAALQGDTLVWQLSDVDADAPLVLGYRLEPLEVGTWPTNVRADADYVDALDQQGRLVFPVPEVTVWDRSSLTHRVYLPVGLDRACHERMKPTDIALIVDTSMSMAEAASPEPGSGTKLEAAVAAVERFVSLLGSSDRAGIVSFNASAATEMGLTASKADLLAALAALTQSPGTAIDTGLAEAGRLLEAARPGSTRAVILLTDGRHGGSQDDVLFEAADLKRAGAIVFTIGLGHDVDATLLRSVASSSGHYYEAPSAGELEEIYEEISARLPCAP